MEILFDTHRFYGGPDPDKPLAEITFHFPEPNRLVVDHTFTDPSLRGQGVARQLVERVAAYAREQGFQAGATCSYAHKVLSAPEYSDIFTD